MTETGGLLLVFAHPDDETFGVAGTMAHARERGLPVTMLCATRGEVGQIAEGVDATPETLGAVRERELRDAMAALGVHDVRFLDYRDSGMKGTPDNDDPRALMNAPVDDVAARIVRVIRERRPDSVITWDESGAYGHPDHVAIHFATKAAVEQAADAGRWPDAGAPFAVPALFYNSIPMSEFGAMMEEMRNRGIEIPDYTGDEVLVQEPPFVPNTLFDASAVVARKWQAILCHTSQLADMAPFMRMPEDLRNAFFSREWFARAFPPVPEGQMLSTTLPDD